MAGRIKHMERSHRSYNKNNYGVFNQFHARAYSVKTLKAQRQTLGQKMANILKPLKDTMRRAVSN